ncbi:D-alanine--D-alanine ligase family protein [Dyadobacter tibetensis]|uniref:D-alanine--D-alanine ligase family protein n=1 Tax=Dyadobacter tibetensis TaxID=1211851 RepID=UPI0004B117B6|nr:D-alanine--D-alanine ligase family protein [Dyadobacter tibetensis]
MKTKVAILFGGPSDEHEVSLHSASNILRALDRQQFEPVLLALDRQCNWCYDAHYELEDIDLVKNNYFQNASFVYLKKVAGGVQLIEIQNHLILSEFQVAFPIIHGEFGEDGTLQGILNSLEIPFVGPSLLGSAIAMDKDITKRLLRDANIPIADYITLYRHEELDYSFETISVKLGVPLFVKPANAGSSIGVSKITNVVEFKQAIKLAFEIDSKILIEEAVFGKEIECAVLGNTNVQASVLGEIITDAQFYSYDDKYNSIERIQTKIPAEIELNISEKIREIALKAFQILSCEGMSRIDFFLREDHTFVLNEVNTLPGFTKTSMYPQLWEKSGLPLPTLLTRLIKLAFERHSK